MNNKFKPEQIIEIILTNHNKILEEDFDETTIDAMLRSDGIDPDALSKRGEEFVKGILENNRLSWQTTAKNKINQINSILTTRRQSKKDNTKLNRQELISKLNYFSQNEYAAAFRNRKPEESTDEELLEMLEELEELEGLEIFDQPNEEDL